MTKVKSAEKFVQDIRRKTRRRFSAEEKIQIVLKGLRGEENIAALCCREDLNPNLDYRRSKEFLKAGKKRLVEGSDLPTRQILRALQVHRSTFYAWYRCYAEHGRAGLA